MGMEAFNEKNIWIVCGWDMCNDEGESNYKPCGHIDWLVLRYHW